MIDPLLETIGLSGWGLFIASIALHEKVIKPLIDWVWDALFFRETLALKRNASEVYSDRANIVIFEGSDD